MTTSLSDTWHHAALWCEKNITWHVVDSIFLRLFLSAVSRLSDVSCLTSQISDSTLHHWKELVAKCMTEYRSSECNKPDNKKLVWIVSRRTAQNLQASHFSVPGLPTIPEGSWDESERLIVHFDFLNLPGCCFFWMKTQCFVAEILTKWSDCNVIALVIFKSAQFLGFFTQSS